MQNQLQDENKVLSTEAVKARCLVVDDVSKKLSEILNYHKTNMNGP